MESRLQPVKTHLYRTSLEGFRSCLFVRLGRLKADTIPRWHIFVASPKAGDKVIPLPASSPSFPCAPVIAVTVMIVRMIVAPINRPGGTRHSRRWGTNRWHINSWCGHRTVRRICDCRPVNDWNGETKTHMDTDSCLRSGGRSQKNG